MKKPLAYTIHFASVIPITFLTVYTKDALNLTFWTRAVIIFLAYMLIFSFTTRLIKEAK
jgi:hypothetical protein